MNWLKWMCVIDLHDWYFPFKQPTGKGKLIVDTVRCKRCGEMRGIKVEKPK